MKKKESHFEYNENHADIIGTGIDLVGGLINRGPDISQRQKDFQTYSQAGFVKGGDPKDDNTWIFDLDWLKNTTRTDPWVSGYRNAIFNYGSPNAQKIMDRWASYKAYNQPASQNAPAKMTPIPTPVSQPAPVNQPTFTAPVSTPAQAPQPITPGWQNQQTTGLTGKDAGASVLGAGTQFTSSTWIMAAVGGVIVLVIILYFANK